MRAGAEQLHQRVRCAGQRAVCHPCGQLRPGREALFAREHELRLRELEGGAVLLVDLKAAREAMERCLVALVKRVEELLRLLLELLERRVLRQRADARTYSAYRPCRELTKTTGHAKPPFCRWPGDRV